MKGYDLNDKGSDCTVCKRCSLLEHDVRIAATYVAKENGKGLSTNDYTTQEKTKLSGVETGAEVNVIEGVSISGGAAATVDSSTKIATLDLSNYALKSDISAAFNVKGSKDTFAELPASGNSSGDVWNVRIAAELTATALPLKLVTMLFMLKTLLHLQTAVGTFSAVLPTFRAMFKPKQAKRLFTAVWFPRLTT